MNVPDEAGSSLEQALVALFSCAQSEGEDCIESVRARFPHHAAELRTVWNNLHAVDEQLADPPPDRPAHTMVPSPAFLPEGEASLPRIPRFRIDAVVGAGSQGVVYRAVQKGTSRVVALKAIRHGAFATPAERRRFELEVELASRLNHPHIVSIYECGDHEGHLFCAMEYVDGQALDSYAVQHLHRMEETIALFILVCAAIAHAHRRGVLHRDLKPSNILVDAEGLPHIVDFGLAKPIVPSPLVTGDDLTSQGEFAGTWQYAAPEQARCDPTAIDVRTDVYALGVILYELLTDCPPYPVDQQPRERIIHHILETPPLPPAALRREIDHDLSTIVLTALQKEPQRRYPSVDALRDDLLHWQAGEPIAARRDNSWYLLRRLAHRHRWKVAVGGMVMGAVFVFAAVITVLYAEARTARATAESRSLAIRATQNYNLDRLAELNRLTNALDASRSPSATSVALQHLQRQPMADTEAFLRYALDDGADSGWLPWGRPFRLPKSPLSVLVQSQEARLRHVMKYLSGRRLALPVHRESVTGFVVSDQPDLLLEAARLFERLVAGAVNEAKQAHPELAVQALNAAQLVLLDISDGPLLLHKATSIVMLDRLCDAWFRIGSEATLNPDLRSALVDWALALHPVPRYGPAMILEREKLAQILESATYAVRPGAQPLVSRRRVLAALTQHPASAGIIPDAENSDDPSLLSVIAGLDTFFGETERWDKLSYSELATATADLKEKMNRHAAWSLIRSLAPDYEEGFRFRGRVCSKRAGLLVTAAIFQYSDRTGQFPASLKSMETTAEAIDQVDPYVRTPIGFGVAAGQARVYSWNEDGIDHAGLTGAWGEPHTDVLFIQWSLP